MMNRQKTSEKERKKIIKQIVQFAVLITVPLTIIGMGVYSKGGDVYPEVSIWLLLPGSLILIGLLGLIRQFFVLRRVDDILSDASSSLGLSYKPYPHSVLNNPGMSGTVSGVYNDRKVNVQCFFHGFQIGRSSLVVKIEDANVDAKLFFSHKKHKLPRIDFWNQPKIPKLSFFLCENGPKIKLVNSEKISLPEKLEKTHILFSEDKVFAEKIIKDNALTPFSERKGAIYVDKNTIYYGQYSLPDSKAEIKEILNALTSIKW